MKIVCFGNEKLATGIPEPAPLIRRALEQAGFEIEAVVTEREVPKHQAELAVLAAYGHILRQAVLDQFPLGIINVHPSLLPIYRGPTPIEQAILDDAEKTGVSTMRLTAGMDEGPVYKQKTVRLTGRETKAELANQLHRLGAELMAETLPLIASGQLKPRRQPHIERDVSYTKLLTKADGEIDWTKPASQLEREVRAYAGWPGSQTQIDSQSATITAARVINASGPAGQFYRTNQGELAAYTRDGSLVIERLKPAGKREMTGREWLAGHRI